MFYVDAAMRAGAALDVPAEYANVQRMSCREKFRRKGRTSNRHVAIFNPGSRAQLVAKGASRVALLGGASLGERHIWWNFVSSSMERIEQAKQQWARRAFPQVPGETEFIPLPER